MKKESTGLGNNPYHVNVITFSGYGFNFNGDTIAVVPEYISEKTEKKFARFINFSAIARSLASLRNTLNIFIMSTNRVEL